VPGIDMTSPVRVAIFSHRWPARYCLVHNVYDNLSWFDTAASPATPSAVVYKTLTLNILTFPAACEHCRPLVFPRHHRSVLRHAQISTFSEQCRDSRVRGIGTRSALEALIVVMFPSCVRLCAL